LWRGSGRDGRGREREREGKIIGPSVPYPDPLASWGRGGDRD